MAGGGNNIIVTPTKPLTITSPNEQFTQTVEIQAGGHIIIQDLQVNSLEFAALTRDQ